MGKCNVKIEAPKNILKGAGYLESKYLPYWIYTVKVTITNDTPHKQLTSLNVVLPNGIRYLNNLHIKGPDRHILDCIRTIQPNRNTENNNVIVFANTFRISPNSQNIISFDIALCDKFTKDSIENNGKKIPHRYELTFCANLLWDLYVSTSKCSSNALEYLVNITSEEESINPNGIVKFYIECKTGQYDIVKNAYFRNILGDSLTYLDGTSNIEPDQIYPLEDKTVLKWEFGSLIPCETKKIGYKVKINDKYKSGSKVKKGDIITNYVNSNCANNTTYTQCPSDDLYELKVVN